MFQLKSFQKEALHYLNKKNHVLCIAPTGSGKSYIYQSFLKTHSQSRALLISPLIALSRQHYEGSKASGLNATLSAAKENALPTKESRIWIMSPEKLFAPKKEKTLSYLENWDPDFLIVDECHCLWEWGLQFRPALAEIPKLYEILKFTQSLWLTATLPNEAKKYLKKRVPSPFVELGKFKLPENLKFHTIHVKLSDRIQALITWITLQRKKNKHYGIVFVLTRAFSKKLCRLLNQAGMNAVYYHAGLSSEERKNIEKLIENEIPHTIIATSAFGMGMNYQHLNWAALWQAPPSLLFLAQAIGRVSRGTQTGEAICLWSEEDFQMMNWIIQNNAAQKKELHHVFNSLKSQSIHENLDQYFNS